MNRKNKLLARYEGFAVNAGYNKNKVVINENFISEDRLKYEYDWNWLIKPLKKALSSDNQNEKWEQLCEAVLSCDIENVYNTLVDFVETENERNKILQAQYFIVISEKGKTVGVIKSDNDNDFNHALCNCIQEHYVVDHVDFLALNMKDFVDQNKSLQVMCFIEGEESISHTIEIQSIPMY